MKLSWRDVGVAVAKFAPVVGGIVGGPIGAGVGEVGSLLAKAFGCDNNPDSIAAAIKADPEAGVKLAQIEADSKVRLAQIAADQAVQRLHEEIADRGSARSMRMSTGDITPDVLTYLTVIALVAAGTAIFTGYSAQLMANTTAVSFATMLLKDLGTMIHKVFDYWFGGSADDSNGNGSQ